MIVRLLTEAEKKQRGYPAEPEVELTEIDIEGCVSRSYTFLDPVEKLRRACIAQLEASNAQDSIREAMVHAVQSNLHDADVVQGFAISQSGLQRHVLAKTERQERLVEMCQAGLITRWDACKFFGLVDVIIAVSSNEYVDDGISTAKPFESIRKAVHRERYDYVSHELPKQKTVDFSDKGAHSSLPDRFTVPETWCTLADWQDIYRSLGLTHTETDYVIAKKHLGKTQAQIAEELRLGNDFNKIRRSADRKLKRNRPALEHLLSQGAEEMRKTLLSYGVVRNSTSTVYFFPPERRFGAEH